MTGHVTIGDLKRDPKKPRVWIYCRDCGHNKHVEPASLGLPDSQSVPNIGQRMKCSKCGGKAIHTKPEVYPGGVPSGIGQN